jgi:hypothetical protein
VDFFPAGVVDPSHRGMSGTTCARRTPARASMLLAVDVINL